MQMPVEEIIPFLDQHGGAQAAREKALQAARKLQAMSRLWNRLPASARGIKLERLEAIQTLRILFHACTRLIVATLNPSTSFVSDDWRHLADEMRRIIREHRRLWLKRNRPGG